MRHTRSITAATLAIALLAVLIPAAALAKPKSKAKAITKSEVISLIKQYSKPGATGAPGAPGAPGTPGTPGTNGAGFSLAQNSGLTIGSNNTLGIMSSLLVPCPAHQALYYLDPMGPGVAWCSFQTQGQFVQGGFTAGNPNAEPQVTLGSTATNVAEETVNYAPGTNKYMVNAVVELESLSSQIATCDLIDETSSTVIEVEEDTVDGYSNLSFLNDPAIPQGDGLAIKCSATGSVAAEATLSAIPLG
jgi:hypothetical protein